MPNQTSNKPFNINSAKPGVNHWEPTLMGEWALIRTQGTAGILNVGFWRTHANAPRCEPDGSCLAAGNAPVHDAVLVLEGAGTITIPSTGRTIEIEPGVVVSHPQGIETRWNNDGPYLRKFFVEWERTEPADDVGDVSVGHVRENPDRWFPCKWTEPSEGEQRIGEAYLVRQDAGPDRALVGVWRAGASVSGSPASPVIYSGKEGDTTLLLLEGCAKITELATGDVHVAKSGDVVSFLEGQAIEWESTTPFIKTFFVVLKHIGA